ncbi:MAG: hypothetical protein AAGF12_32045 [Myxococcota bacterium]
MLKYLFYPIFGTAVLGGYAMSASSATDISSVNTQRSTIPAQYRAAGGFAAAPVVWRTGFHGPSAYRPSYSSSSGSSYGGGGGYYYGGSSYGK